MPALNAAPQRLASLNSLQRLALAVIVIAGLALRLAFHATRPFDGDELGTLIYIEKTFGFILTHFIDPWLTMNWYLAGLKAVAHVFESSPLALSLPSLLADGCSMVLVAALAIRMGTPSRALATAALYAMNPFLIKYAGIIRAYSLLVAFALATLVCAIDWCDRPTRRTGAGFAFFALCTFLAQPVGIWVVLFGAVLVMARIIRTASTSRATALRESLTLIVPGLPAAVAAYLAYRPVLAQVADVSATYSWIPPTAVNYLPQVATAFFGSGFFVLPSLALLAAGWMAAARSNPRLFLLSGIAPWLMACYSLQGVSMWPWAMSRYLIVVLPVLLVIMAEGLVLWCKSPRKLAAATLVIAATWLPNARTVYQDRQEHPVDDLVAHLRENLREDDVLVGLDSWALLRLMHPFAGRFQLVPGYAARTGQPPGARLVVVSAGAHIPTSARYARFGVFQVTSYNEPTRLDRVHHLYNDLRVAGAGLPRADMAEYYSIMLKLRPVVAPDDDDAELTRLWLESRQRTRKGRWPLPQMLETQRDAWY